MRTIINSNISIILFTRGKKKQEPCSRGKGEQTFLSVVPWWEKHTINRIKAKRPNYRLVLSKSIQTIQNQENNIKAGYNIKWVPGLVAQICNPKHLGRLNMANGGARTWTRVRFPSSEIKIPNYPQTWIGFGGFGIGIIG